MRKELKDILEGCRNIKVFDSFVKCDSVLNETKNGVCSISGGSDSDIVLDILSKVDKEKKITYIWLDTGMEYEATKEHLEYLENKYNVKINRIRPKKPIPLCVKEYGEPFLSKYVSEQIMRLQKHYFKWEDKPYEELIREYPKCKVALRWWCNAYEKDGKVIECSRFSIKRNKWLKEFIIKHPPDFPVSNKCCYYAKKSTVYVFLKDIGADLDITGIRKSEGGIRETAYKNCLSIDKQKGCRVYRPIFWYNNSDKEYYEKRYDITHSRCYTEYGFKRTGCVGCPYNRKITEELSVIKEKEPKLYAAALSVFGRSYEYTRQYREFQREMNEQEREIKAAA